MSFSESNSLRALIPDRVAKKLNESGRRRAFLQAVTGHGRTGFAAVQIGQIAISAVLLDEINSKALSKVEASHVL